MSIASVPIPATQARAQRGARRFAASGLAVLLAAAASSANAITLDRLVASGGTLTFGGLSFSQFAIQPVPLSSPQGAVVNNGDDIDVSVGSFSGAPGLHLLQIDPATQAASPLTVDLSTKGQKNTLRNISYVVTVLDPQFAIHAVTQALGPNSGARGAVTGFIATYDFQPGAVGASLLDQASLIDPALGGGYSFNSPGLTAGDAASLGFDTAWALTSAHGNPTVGSARVDFIDVSYTLAPVPEPTPGWMTASGLLALGLWRARAARPRTASGR